MLRSPLLLPLLLLLLTVPSASSASEPGTLRHIPGPRFPSKWLSMYSNCVWGSHPRPSRGVSRVGSASNGPSQQPPRSSGVARSNTVVAHLPTLFGPCTTTGPRWGCWLDQLAVATAHNVSSMLQVTQLFHAPHPARDVLISSMLQIQVSGPVYCGVSHGAIGDVYLCPDDCNDTTLDPHVDWIHGVRGPGAGTCGLEWVRRTLRWSREHVVGRLPGVMRTCSESSPRTMRGLRRTRCSWASTHGTGMIGRPRWPRGEPLKGTPWPFARRPTHLPTTTRPCVSECIRVGTQVPCLNFTTGSL
eukprot:SAG31_NODE_6424_length_2025_cov_2.901869_2_plen_302_part_00